MARRLAPRGQAWSALMGELVARSCYGGCRHLDDRFVSLARPDTGMKAVFLRRGMGCPKTSATNTPPGSSSPSKWTTWRPIWPRLGPKASPSRCH